VRTWVTAEGVFRMTGERGDAWPEAVSDGLSLPCTLCRRQLDFGFMVTDEIWRRVVPLGIRRDVLCLHCLDRLATDEGIDISACLMSVQYIGIGKTIILLPTAVIDWAGTATMESTA